jgi:NAD(P)-dependent dehydrogenase (short-subunit alcohol dehydrogenase family)
VIGDHRVPALTAITGGSGSIGLATAAALLAADPEAAVVLLDLVPGDAARELLAADPGRAHFVACDVTDPAAVAAAFARIDELGALDGLVYAAGLVDNSDSTDLEFERWRAVLAVNLDGAMLCNQEAGRRMLGAGTGAIVNIASIAGRFGHPRRLPYSVGKAAIGALTRTLAVEWAQGGVRVNAVAPGYVDTPMVREGERLGLFSREQAAEMHAMKRLAAPAELADPIVYLLSSAAAFVTGETLYADGGFSVLKAS